MRIFSGVQPTKNPHIGNYLGAIRNWVDLQRDFQSIFCVVDLHAITVPQDPAELAAQTREVVAAYLACGIDAERSIIFNQASVAGHAQLGWLLSCQTPLGWLNRMTQFKDKAGKNRDSVGLGLYAYPVLMAADILLYKATHVPVGEDQKQHLELARDIAGAFNRLVGVEHFPLPVPQILGQATRVMSLRDGTKKMSKSEESDLSRINLMDSADAIANKLKKAKTDPEPLPYETADLPTRPEAENLVGIMAALQNCDPQKILNQYGGKNFSEFKPALTDAMVAAIVPIGDKMRNYMADQAYIDGILVKGAHRAREIATPILAETHKLLGILQF
ncbi:MAG: tryptophan--tRNA ligase [Candidatus Symbiobacter sp.]|nr:tryptophan--tRNA ligase [Candidatus Symbiobacter sp.]